MAEVESRSAERAPSLREAQAEVDASIRALGGYWPPLANLARLFEECGELARAVNQASGPKQVKSGEAQGTADEELGDVLYVALVLANSLGIDAADALEGVLRKVRGRAAAPSAPGRNTPAVEPSGDAR